MPTYIVKQPNGRLAAFSTVTDSFVAVDMTEEESVAYLCSRRHTPAEAANKVRRGANDDVFECGGPKCCDQGLFRWHDALGTILHAHGTAALATFLAENPTTYCKLLGDA